MIKFGSVKECEQSWFWIMVLLSNDVSEQMCSETNEVDTGSSGPKWKTQLKFWVYHTKNLYLSVTHDYLSTHVESCLLI